MSKEEPIKADLIEDRVVSKGKNLKRAQQVYDKSCFGEPQGGKKKRIEYSLVEALFLLEREKMEIFDSEGESLKFGKFASIASEFQESFWTRYKVYKDLRKRGYILKTALKFGADFRVYERGKRPGEGHAKWLLYCVDENDSLIWREFAAKNRVAHSTRKKLLIGCVDDEGDVTYWKISWERP